MDTSDEDANIYETSFVEEPATGFSFLKFKKEDVKTLEFKQVEKGEYKRMISGVWFMPDTKYLRYDAERGLYTVEFKQDALKEAVIKYLKANLYNNVKVEHQGSYLEGFISMEHWIYEDENTKSPIFGLTIEDLGYDKSQVKAGTVFKTVYVEDESFWTNEILSGNVKGFSIGGLFSLEEEKMTGELKFSDAEVVVAEVVTDIPNQDELTQGQSVPAELPSERVGEGDDAIPSTIPSNQEPSTDLSQILERLSNLESTLENYKQENSLLKQQLNEEQEKNALINSEKEKIAKQSETVINNLQENLKTSPIKPIQKSYSKPSEIVSDNLNKSIRSKVIGGVTINY